MSQADFASAANLGEYRPKRVLIASGNRYSFCIGVERHFALSLRDVATVDALDLYSLVTRHSPYYRKLSYRLSEKINRKYERFILPALSGRDITTDIRLDLTAIPPVPATFDELRNHELRGARIGVGVLSSMISLTTVQDTDDIGDLGTELLHSWRAAHLSLQVGEAVRDLGYDEVYLFNGRHCYNRPFRDVLEQTARVIKYEVGGCEDTTTYVASEKSVHDPATFAGLIRAHDINVEEGEAFYRERISRSAGNEVNYFIGIQTEGEIPEEVRGREFVAYFTSSTDERVAALGEHDLGAFPDQCVVALELARICAEQGKLLVVRMHPHLRFKHSTWRREWDFDALRAAGAIIVAPDATCDSYTLARAANCAVTSGSTISFECSILGVPNAVVGDCLPGRLGSSHVCNDAADLSAFIAAPSLPENARDNALIYGSYMRVGGIPIPGYELNGDVSLARFEGRVLDPVRRTRHKLKRLIKARP